MGFHAPPPAQVEERAAPQKPSSGEPVWESGHWASARYDYGSQIHRVGFSYDLGEVDVTPTSPVLTWWAVGPMLSLSAHRSEGMQAVQAGFLGRVGMLGHGGGIAFEGGLTAGTGVDGFQGAARTRRLRWASEGDRK
jgi:hypothetical protein